VLGHSGSEGVRVAANRAKRGSIICNDVFLVGTREGVRLSRPIIRGGWERTTEMGGSSFERRKKRIPGLRGMDVCFVLFGRVNKWSCIFEGGKKQPEA